jgi:hypothetical protein
VIGVRSVKCHYFTFFIYYDLHHFRLLPTSLSCRSGLEKAKKELAESIQKGVSFIK